MKLHRYWKKAITAVTLSAAMVAGALGFIPQTAKAADFPQKGQTIKFGHYEQDNNFDNGPEAIEWIVVKTEGNQALLLSKYVLDQVEFSTNTNGDVWESCTLRNWMNNDFYNSAFDQSEKAQIIETELINKQNPSSYVSSGNNTKDKVFALSVDEVYDNFNFTYFTTSDGEYGGYSQELVAEATPYAIYTKKLLVPYTFTAEDSTYFANQCGYTVDTTGWKGNYWWLRTSGYSNRYACFVGEVGYCYASYTSLVYNYNFGVRPAMWLSLDSFYDGVDYSAVFDKEYYLANNPDIADSLTESPIEHFVNQGMSEGRQGNALFSLEGYKKNNPDLVEAFGDDNKQYYLHYINGGKADGRFAIDLPTAPEGSVNMYRMYNPNSGEHFYTGKAKEVKSLFAVGWEYEGVAWVGPTESNTPVYRLYNPNTGDHHYTPSKKERDSLIKAGWNNEDIGWYSDDAKTKPLYRLYNPNATTGSHHYTTSTKERDQLVKIGWNDEGIGWYGY